MKTIRYKGKGAHSIKELELIIEQKLEELHFIKSGQNKIIDSESCLCGSSKIIKTFIKSGIWLGSSSANMREYDLNDKRFETRKYEFGHDFYAKDDLLKTRCEQCGKTDFIKC